MIKHAILFIVFIFALVPCSFAAERPNVLFIAVDDWNDWVGVYGAAQAKTPNPDRLAAQGVAFRYAHTSAVYCAPSRTSPQLQSGRPHR